MGKIIEGDKIALKLFKEIKDEVSKLNRAPVLGVVLVGNNFASASYVKGKIKAGKKVGIEVKVFDYPQTATESEILEKIQNLNNDEEVDGIIVQLPLPVHLNESIVVNSVRSSKDVDGFTFYNAGRLFRGKPLFKPCTPKGILHMLRESNIEVANKHVVVVGRSNLVGLPLSRLFVEADATVSICHSKTKNLEAITSQADILCVAIGQKEFIKSKHVKKGAVVIDVGINRDDNNKLVGDVDFNDVFEKVSYITPVPKGVGPLTISMLLMNTLSAYKGDFYE
ncbi:MAG: bifunctional 5,10-methylenetetrahydrofolate dehydrogenase/5,10-methenyltetrahydrofolate cyclohydrolase [Erysipelothrix sp.]|nr:bifunctional 5,10-methylenetetrahydrofolate dehydrogenase/5,10-methenyltetrahydrofolate cyclohydrolase [Erysipelothrix sp.]